MQLQQVINLVRAEAERQREIGQAHRHLFVTPDLARQMIERAAWLLVAASACPAGGLQAMSDFATRCQSHRFLKKHCGGCEEYDKSIQCPAGSGVAL
jgi:hypothetical protein